MSNKLALKIVAFAGIDGAGKTTQAAQLTAWLGEMGYAASFVPNRSLRRLRAELDAVAQEHGERDLFGFLGADAGRLALAMPKWHAFDQALVEARGVYDVLIFDRYVHCQLAHARFRNVSNYWLHERLFAMFPPPDVTLYLDIDPHLASDRVGRRGHDCASVEWLARLKACYEKLGDFHSFVRLDANVDVEALARRVRDVVAARLARPQPGNAKRMG
jgi:dTMP kinase